MKIVFKFEIPLAMQLSQALVLVVVAGCGNEAGARDANVDNFDRRDMLEHLAQQVLLPMQATVASTIAVLPSTIDGYCDALDLGEIGGSLNAARAELASSVDAWQRAQAVLVGPAAMNNRELGLLIYSWPTVSTCEIDRDTASRWVNPSSYNINDKSIRVRSLSAIEYLLHPPNDAHSCVIVPPEWGNLGNDVSRARCRLAEIIAVDVAQQAASLIAQWEPGDGYATVLAHAGSAGSVYGTAHEAVNEVAGAMFYVDHTVKDMKLAEPAGITSNACGTIGTPCMLEVELPFSDRTTFAILANLTALREVFTGKTATTDGPGFDDFLIAVGHTDVAERMTTNLDAAIAAAAQLPASFKGALANDYAKVVAAHEAIRAFTTDLKSQFLTLLALELPKDVPTDND